MLRLRRIALFSVLGLLGLLLGVVVGFVLLRGGTPALRDDAGRVSPRAIAKLEWPALGGVRQAVLLQGADTANPVVLFLHGGPGMPTMYLAHAFQRPLENDFVMVQWDRRGAGKSYGARVPAESLTVQRTLADLYELTLWLRTRFHQDRIYLAAHSWGTWLGVVAVTEHPEWYRGYIGRGQLVPHTAAAHATQRTLVLEEARRRGDRALVARLASPGATARESELFAVGGEMRNATGFWPLLRTGLMAPEYTLFDAWNVRRGGAAAQPPDDRLGRLADWREHRVGTRFSLLGRYDYNTPSALTASYVDSLVAPLKGVVWFEHSAHFPFFEEPERFGMDSGASIHSWPAIGPMTASGDVGALAAMAPVFLLHW